MPDDNKSEVQFNDLILRLAQDRPFPFSFSKNGLGDDILEIFPFGSQRKIRLSKDGTYEF